MSRPLPPPYFAAFVITLAAWLSGTAHGAPPGRQSGADDSDWSAYGGDQEGNRFSNAAQIDAANVGSLREAWRYRTRELGAGLAHANQLAFEATPILAGGSLYLSTPTDTVIALDPGSGRERWRYDPHIPRNGYYDQASSRGVSSWFDAQLDSSMPCSHRIFIVTLDARLLALDGRTGQLCKKFGVDGVVELAMTASVAERGHALLTSPPALYRDLVVVGLSSVVRAFDARSGELRWSWRAGGVHALSTIAVDAGRDIVFLATGSTGVGNSDRHPPGDAKYANSLVALRALSGEIIWHRQLVHHDRWGYDITAQPLLIDIERDGKAIAAVVQATPTGQLFVFDRETGEPVFEVIERPVPASKVPGETAAPTQPFPITPALVSHAALVPQDAWGLTFVDRGSCRELLSRYRSEGIFTPPDLKGTIVSPGNDGGIGWGSLAFDSDRQLAIAAVNHLPSVITLIPRHATDSTARADSAETAKPAQTRYTLQTQPLLSPLGLPCTAPPWGTLAAVDLRRNSIRWQVVLGTTRDSTPWYVPRRRLGMPNRGGPIVTAGGLVFIAAATDNFLRAFDVETGRELWRGRLPAGGQATPMSYEINGRQFIVIVAGGHPGLGTTRGDFVVAFALPP